jgi:hypothetical protein
MSETTGQKLWNPKARHCSSCSDLKKIQDKKTKTIDQQKKYCERFGWEIPNELAEKQALCKIELDKTPKRRKRKAGRS